MRTNTLVQLIAELFGLKWLKKTDPQRGYHADASIGFWLESAEVEIDPLTLKEAIRKADEAAPWKDEPLPDDTFESIRNLSDGKACVHNFHVPEKVWWFKLTPYRGLRLNQLHAYKKYLDGLGEILARKNISGVKKVTCALCVVHSADFS